MVKRDDLAEWVYAVSIWLFMALVLAVSISVPVGYMILAIVRSAMLRL